MKIWALFLVICIANLVLALPAMAQSQKTLGGKTLPSEDEAFAAVFENPSDLLLNFRLAAAQFRSGNIKGAAATLERILTLTPQNSEAQALLAAAQFRLGNTAEARRAGERLLANPKATQDQKDDISKLLMMINAAEKRYSIDGAVSFGNGIIDNPDGGSIGNRAHSGGILNKRADAHGFQTFHAAVDFTGKFVSQLPEHLSFGAAFSKRDTNNYNLGDSRSYALNTRYSKSLNNMQINMGAAATAMSLDGRQYLDIYNAHASTRYGLPFNIAGLFTARMTRNIYRNSFDRSLARRASEKTGTTTSLAAKLTRGFTHFQLGAGVTAYDAGARRRYNARDTFDWLADINFLIDGNIATLAIKHSASAYQEGHPDYGGAVRDDFTNTISAAYSIGLGRVIDPLEKEARLHLSASYGKTKSTIANFSKYSGQGQIVIIQPF